MEDVVESIPTAIYTHATGDDNAFFGFDVFVG